MSGTTCFRCGGYGTYHGEICTACAGLGYMLDGSSCICSSSRMAPNCPVHGVKQTAPGNDNDPRNWPGGGGHCCECGIALTPENMVGIVTEKPPAIQPWETPEEMAGAVIEATCKRCAGIPDGLESPDAR